MTKVLFKNVNVLDCTGAPPFAGQVLVEGNRIKAVAPRGTAVASDGSQVVDGAGATLMGPIADRAVVSHVTPLYPDWAKGEGVEGSVTLYFVVRPDGSVRENVLVQKTAGFEDFDENARTALRAWRFEALHEGRIGDQWGTITFHFRLRDSG